MKDFRQAEIAVKSTTIFVRVKGAGPALLLLHGFPETHLMWRRVAPLLAERFTVVCADLRGYGQSGFPESTADHAPYSKRAMAADMVAVMEQLGFQRFHVAGHDRGGRVAYRLALDYPERVERIAVLDVIPTGDVWDRADSRFATAFWPWALLAQPEPLPERILLAAGDAVLNHALGQWDTPLSVFEPEVRIVYERALRHSAHAHAICEEYRAAATVDREHDRADRAAGRRIACPLLVLWSDKGALETWYTAEGGPIGIWQTWAEHVQGRSFPAGHFFPEEMPAETAEAFIGFFGSMSAK